MSAQRASQLVEAGLWLRLSGDHEGAKRLFEQALKLDPGNARARQLLDSPPPSAPPAGVAKTTMDLDWGLATGHSPTPPPVAPLAPPIIKTPSNTPGFGGAAPGTHTVRLGESLAPEIPEAPRFEDPHNEVVITGADDPVPENSTMVFGMSGVPVPPAAPSGAPSSSTLMFSGTKGEAQGPSAPASGTMVFGAGGKTPSPQTGPADSGTMVFGSGGRSPQPQTGPADSGTMVFGSGGRSPSPQTGPADSGTMVFGSGGKSPQPQTGPADSGTMVFGSGGKSPQPQTGPPDSGTMVFGAAGKGAPAVPPVTPGTMVFGTGGREAPPPVPSTMTPSTLVFGSQDRSAPPSIAPVSSGTIPFISPREQSPVVTEPGVPPFMSETLKPHADPGKSSSGTLEFNFDDMVAPPGPIASPPVPYDKDDDDGPKTAWDRSNPRIDIAQIEAQGQGGGFDLISAEPPPPPKPRSPAQLREEVSTLLSGAKDLLDLDDHSGAMELISKALELDPSDAGALKLKERSEKTLQAMYESKLGDLNETPRVKLKDDEIIWLNLDHRAGFVLAQIDGSVTYEDLFAVSGMSRLDTARILAQLVEEGVISKG